MNIEEIKKEIITIKDQMLKEYTIDLTNDKTREFYYIQCLDMVLRIIEEHNNQQTLVTLKDFENVSNKLIDYKGAWEELKIKFTNKESGYDKYDFNLMQELEQKYNLGGE